MEDICFNEQKAREVINFLLLNDINLYKKLVPEINRLNSEAIEMLFNGEINYDYNIKNKGILKKLLDKFENFQILLEQWYKDKKYYEYLKILWIKYPCIEDLKGRNMQEIEEIMKSFSIEFKSWPQDIKDNFKELINQTTDTRIIELKKEIEKNYPLINNIFNELAFIKKESKFWKDEGKYLSYNSNKIMENLSLSITPFEICNAGKSYQNLSCPKIEEVEISSENHDDDQEKLLNVNNNNRKLEELESLNKAEIYIVKNKIVSCIHAGLSFINLFWSIYALRQNFKDANLIAKYKCNLKIINDFKLHQELIGILPDNLKEATKHILEILDLIKADQKKLKLIYDDISKKIEFQESKKWSSIKSIILGIICIAYAFLTHGLTSAIYNNTSYIINGITIAIHLKNLSESSKYIKQYKEFKNLLQV